MTRKRAVERYERNPFMSEIAGMKTRKKRVTVKAGKVIMDADTGQYEDVAEVVSVHNVDNDQFVKVFTSNLKQFFNLRPTTYKLLQVLLFQLGKTKDRGEVYLSMKVAEQYFETTAQPRVSSTAYYAAMNEFIEKGFIAESVNANLYWINPSLFFNGDRVRFVKEYRNTEYRQGELELDDSGTGSDVALLPAGE